MREMYGQVVMESDYIVFKRNPVKSGKCRDGINRLIVASLPTIFMLFTQRVIISGLEVLKVISRGITGVPMFILIIRLIV